MSSKMQNANFSTLISEAEDAVKNVKDARLKEIAFERVLDHLLSISTGHVGTPAAGRVGNAPTRNLKHKTIKSPKLSGPLGWIKELADENFFAKPKSLNDIVKELDKRSHRLKATDLTRPLQTLCHEKILRRDKIGHAEGGKKVLHWYNW